MSSRSDKFGILLVLFLCLMVAAAGCAQWVTHPAKTMVTHVPSTEKVEITDMKRVAIFPFADYSQTQIYQTSPDMGINQRVLEEIADSFVAHGIEIAVEEDVIGLLKSENVIVVSQNGPDRGTAEWDLKHQHHLPAMQQNITNMLRDDKVWGSGEGKAGGAAQPQGALAGMSKGMIKKIGKELDVDKVVRGRIIDYGITTNKTFNPANGVLAVALGGVLESVGAFTRREGFEEGLPSETSRANSYSSGDGGIGMDVPPNEQTSNVQIRVYLQDVENGRILWSNRAFVRYYPPVVFSRADNHPQRMLDAAVKEAVKELMDDLFKVNAPGQEPKKEAVPIQEEKSAPVVEEKAISQEESASEPPQVENTVPEEEGAVLPQESEPELQQTENAASVEETVVLQQESGPELPQTENAMPTEETAVLPQENNPETPQEAEVVPAGEDKPDLPAELTLPIEEEK